MSSKILKLTSRRIKKIIAEEKEKINVEKQINEAKRKKKLLEALKFYAVIKENKNISKNKILKIRNYIKTLR